MNEEAMERRTKFFTSSEYLRFLTYHKMLSESLIAELEVNPKVTLHEFAVKYNMSLLKVQVEQKSINEYAKIKLGGQHECIQNKT